MPQVPLPVAERATKFKGTTLGRIKKEKGLSHSRLNEDDDNDMRDEPPAAANNDEEKVASLLGEILQQLKAKGQQCLYYYSFITPRPKRSGVLRSSASVCPSVRPHFQSTQYLINA